MPALELYGKCKELGYCDCGGFFGCVDPSGPKRALLPQSAHCVCPVPSASSYKNHNLKRELSTTPARPAPTPVRWDEPKAEPPKRIEQQAVEPETCRNGHARMGNTYLRNDGRKECSICRRERKRRELVPVEAPAASRLEKDHRVVVELPGIRITIEPVEETNGP
jgi:hypothetical protein